MPRKPRVNQFPIGPPSVLQHPKLSLLGLPGELRDNIWACIFANISRGHSIHCSKSAAKANRRFAILLACRQIYHEASDVAYRQVTFYNTSLFDTLVNSPQYPNLACLGRVKRFRLSYRDLPYLRSTLERCHFPLERLELRFDMFEYGVFQDLADEVRKFIVNTPTIKTLLLLGTKPSSGAIRFLRNSYTEWRKKPEYGGWITDGTYLTNKPCQISAGNFTMNESKSTEAFELNITSSGVERTVLVQLQYIQKTKK